MPELATLRARLGAALIDLGLQWLCLIFFWLGWFQKNTFLCLLAGLLWLSLLFVQAKGIALNGQSIGKKRFGIQILRLDGSRAGFVRGVVVRSWLFAALEFGPRIGSVLNTAGFAMIFHESRRCLHDRIAGTIVVKSR